MSERSLAPPVEIPERSDTEWARASGAAIVRDIQVSLHERVASPPMPKAQSHPALQQLDYPDVTPSSIAQPGGFRRHYLTAAGSLSESEAVPLGRNFVDVLLNAPDMYRSFGGGLPVDDSDDEDDRLSQSTVESATDAQRAAAQEGGYALLHPETSADGVARGLQKPGASSISKLVLAIIKAFVGSAVLFLPRGFYNGGILFSALLLAFMSVISTYCCLLLVSARSKVGGSFGYVGKRALGRAGQVSVNVSVVLSQVGFCCAYVVFVAKNARVLLHVITGRPESSFPVWLLIIAQLPLYIPLSWVRRISKFAYTNLIADGLILAGLLAILTYACSLIFHPPDAGRPSVMLFDEANYAVFLGTAVYSFEGVGLIIPLYESTRGAARAHFSRVFALTIAGVTAFFLLFAVTGYLAFGDSVRAVITLNLPMGAWWVVSLQAGYSLALIFTFPLMMFPAIRIVENLIFKRTPRSLMRKWLKNAFRAFMCLAAAAISLGASDQLDHFVSLIGSVCCVPLLFVYPPLFHHILVPEAPRWRRVANIALIVFGSVTMVFTTVQTMQAWAKGGSD